MLTPTTLPSIQQALDEAGLDGWLIFDFHGMNPIARGLLGLEGFVSRRIFALIPRTGRPVAITHAIEQMPWRDWPSEWGREVYSSWRTLESELQTLVAGKRLAMEYSPGDAVPYVDRVPAGVLEMVRAAGAEVVSSGELISRFYATLNPRQVAAHEKAAEQLATIARDAFTLAGARARSDSPITERELQRWIVERFEHLGLSTDHGPNVSAGANAANPHYEPSASREIADGEIVLIDLWAHADDGIWADQTWMASLGEPSARSQEIWRAVRDARDAAIALLRERVPAGRPVRGGEIDDAARGVIAGRGLGEYFTHRTGHSIDPRDLHGSGPHLDNLETREERLLIPGVAFSIEPGVYIEGEIGMRTEVNAVVGERSVTITPAEYQTELIIV